MATVPTTTQQQDRKVDWSTFIPNREDVLCAWHAFGLMLQTGSPFFQDDSLEGGKMRCAAKRLFKDMYNGEFPLIGEYIINDAVTLDAPPPPTLEVVRKVWQGVWHALQHREYFENNSAGRLVRYQVSIACYQLTRWRWEAAAHSVIWAGTC